MADRSTVRGEVPRARVIVAPLYPRGILLPHDMLAERAAELQMLNMIYLRDFRLIHNAIISVDEDDYFEVNVHGIVFCEGRAEIVRDLGTPQDSIPFVYLVHLIRLPTRILNHALMFLKGMATNILIRNELFGWQGIGFLPLRTQSYANPGSTARMHKCVNPHVAVSTPAVLETLADWRIEVLTDIVKQLLFAFNCSHADLQNKVGRTLRKAQLI